MNFGAQYIFAGITLGLSAGVTLGQSGPPTLVSPGSQRMVSIDERCPTFNWAGVRGAEALDLVVYSATSLDQATEAAIDPVIQTRLPGTATGWTPSLDRCLQSGLQYAWSIRTLTENGPGAWSTPNLFQVAAPLSLHEIQAAIVTLERLLREARSMTAPLEAENPPVVSLPPPPQSPQGDSASLRPPATPASVGPGIKAEVSDGIGVYGVGHGTTVNGIGVQGDGDHWGVYGSGGTYGVLGVGNFGVAGSGSAAGGFFINQLGGDLIAARNNPAGADIFRVDNFGFVYGQRFYGDAYGLYGISDLQITDNSITEDDIGPDAVGQSELKANSVTGSAVQDWTMGAEDFANGIRTGLEIPSMAGSIPNGGCVDFGNAILQGAAQVGDQTLVIPESDLPDGWVMMGLEVATINAGTVRLCNFTGAAADEPAGAHFAVIVIDTA